MIEERITVRARRRITLPPALVARMGVHEGSQLIVVWDQAGQQAIVRPIRDSYAGLLRGTYGDEAATQAYLEGERGSWTAP